jgi:ATP-binding cassette subfamily B protein
MWSDRGGIEEDQKLGRTQTRVVLMRSIRMAGEFRRQGAWALVLVTISVLCTLAGPVLVRHGIDSGIRKSNADVLNITVVLYLVVVAIAYVIGRMQYVVLNSAGEGFLRLLRIRVFGQMQRQSMAFLTARKPEFLLRE